MNCYKCATPVPENSRFCLSCGADLSGETAERTLPMEADPELQMKLQAELGGDFIIERELGRGGMAAVYLAADAHLGRKVAVKVLPPELTRHGGAGLVERFKREARTAATLDHPHIIPVHRVSTGGKLFWYVMKYLEGEVLDSILKREPQLPVERTVDIIRQVAEALGYAHGRHVVHRDVKPANVMLDENDWVTVTDFGIAKALDTSSLTGSGAMIGTPYYMSPEQCSGKPVTGASDQYSLGVMTYQMLGGHLPFIGESVVEIIKKHVMDPVPPLGVLRPNLLAQVVSVVERALAKNPEQRFETVTDFARALDAAVQGLDVTLAPPARVRRGRGSQTALVSPVPGAIRTAKGTWRHRKAAIVGGVGSLVVVAAAAIVFWPNAATDRPGELPSASAPSTQLAAAPGVPTDTSAVRDSASARPDTTPAAASPPAVVPIQPRSARLTLSDLPAGAAVTRDGRAVRGSRMDLEPGRRHTVTVALAGREPWTESFTPRPGERITRAVTLRPVPSASAPQQASPMTPQPEPAALAAAQPARPAVGFISLVTQPRSTVYVNGVARSSPLVNFQVAAGVVRLRFQVQDSTIWWAADREVTVNPGDTARLGLLRLVRP